MKKFTTFLLGFLICLNVSFACINDSNSRLFEMQPFPNEQELISGSFHVHSKEFHEWRIKDRLTKLKKDPNNPALLDDLSVSYEKTGQTQVAIDTLQSVLHKYPNRYETLANLGTFYIHHQEYQKGLELLRKAIKINPEAHYGREIYQIKVVEYLLSLNKKPPFVFPIQSKENFADFLLKGIAKDKQKDELIRGIVGVSGMLKFGNNDSPILLEVLGDLYLKIAQKYTSKPSFKQETHLALIAKQFYIAAFIKSKLNNNQIIYEFLKNKQDLNLEYINRYNSQNLDSIIEHDISVIKNDINTSQEEKVKNIEKEINIIKNSIDPENEIQLIFFAKPQKQQNLFKNQEAKINTLIDFYNLSYKNHIVESIGLIIWPCIIISILLFIGLFLNYFYLTNKNLLKQEGKISESMNYVKSYRIFWMITSVFISLLLITTLFSSNEDLIFLFILPVFILFIASLVILRNINNTFEIFEIHNIKFSNIIIKSKKFLWFNIYTCIVLVILTQIWSNRIESDRLKLLSELQKIMYTHEY